MVVPLELQDEVLPCGRPRNPDSVACRIHATVGEYNHVSRRHELPEHFRKIHFEFDGRAEHRPLPGLLLDCLDHVRVGMTVNQGAEREEVVNVGVVVRVDDLGTGSAFHEERVGLV
jgi:hypothetical protein